MNKKILLFLFIFLVTRVFPQIDLQLITWNIQDLGRTKSDSEITQMAKILKYYDIVAIQEVVAIDPGGAQAVARLADELNRLGSKWDYVVSNPTSSPPYKTERYAFLWKTAKAKAIGRGRLLKELKDIVDREPFLIQFNIQDKVFYILNFHARTYNQEPEKEIEAIIRFMETLQLPVILAGDFNTNENNSIYQTLYALNYVAVVRNTPTTLKRKCYAKKYKNHAIDNIFMPTDHFEILESDVVDWIKSCDRLLYARTISDHLPVYLKFQWKN